MTTYLVDKSAWVWAGKNPVANADFSTLMADGDTLLAGCHLTALELAYSARNAADHTAILDRQRKDLLWLPVTEQVMDRSLEVIAMLARRGQHRCPIPDVVIAACAELHGATVLHVDSDYEMIANATGQPVRRLATT